jgi:hypothetical protein
MPIRPHLIQRRLSLGWASLWIKTLAIFPPVFKMVPGAARQLVVLHPAHPPSADNTVAGSYECRHCAFDITKGKFIVVHIW